MIGWHWPQPSRWAVAAASAAAAGLRATRGCTTSWVRVFLSCVDIRCCSVLAVQRRRRRARLRPLAPRSGGGSDVHACGLAVVVKVRNTELERAQASSMTTPSAGVSPFRTGFSSRASARRPAAASCRHFSTPPRPHYTQPIPSCKLLHILGSWPARRARAFCSAQSTRLRARCGPMPDAVAAVPPSGAVCL